MLVEVHQVATRVATTSPQAAVTRKACLEKPPARQPSAPSLLGTHATTQPTIKRPRLQAASKMSSIALPSNFPNDVSASTARDVHHPCALP